ncbi:hypothetical protein AB0C69_04310 [Actinomadura sp. NPDC048032]|uniref:hypothetical protein n=1 Tax=Actinomadura sp. NPDC048032 TaxID=3155747 RepID=UPI0033E27998
MNTLDDVLPAAGTAPSVPYRRWRAGLADARRAHAVPLVAVPLVAVPVGVAP